MLYRKRRFDLAQEGFRTVVGDASPNYPGDSDVLRRRVQGDGFGWKLRPGGFGDDRSDCGPSPDRACDQGAGADSRSIELKGVCKTNARDLEFAHLYVEKFHQKVRSSPSQTCESGTTIHSCGTSNRYRGFRPHSFNVMSLEMKNRLDSDLPITDNLSRFFNERKPETKVDTLVIHTMHCVEADCGDALDPLANKKVLDKFEVSAHYIIDPLGNIWRMVAEDKCAWHSGVSKLPFDDDPREGLNEFSIGIECLATYESGLTEAQYNSLASLTQAIVRRHGIVNIVGHSDVAPDRKTDPWNFNWKRYVADVRAIDGTAGIRFPAHAT